MGRVWDRWPIPVESKEAVLFERLRTIVYPVTDLAEGKVWWSQLLARAPYFDEPYYVGFDVNGYEVGLVPSTGDDGPTTYWRVPDADAAFTELLAAGAAAQEEPREVGGGIRSAAARDPSDNLVGVIHIPGETD